MPRKSSSSEDAFSPPTDGRLTAADVDLYLKVLRETVKVAVPRTPKPAESAAVPLSSLAGEGQGGTPDVAAARRLGVRVEQYLWIRERVLEAGAVESNARLDRTALADLEASIAELSARKASAPDEPSKRLIESQMEIFMAEVSRLKKEAGIAVSESVRRNIELIRPHQTELEGLQSQVLRDLQLLEAPPATASPASTP